MPWAPAGGCVSAELATGNGLILSIAPLPSNLPLSKNQSVSSMQQEVSRRDHSLLISGYCLLPTGYWFSAALKRPHPPGRDRQYSNTKS